MAINKYQFNEYQTFSPIITKYQRIWSILNNYEHLIIIKKPPWYSNNHQLTSIQHVES